LYADSRFCQQKFESGRLHEFLRTKEKASQRAVFFNATQTNEGKAFGGSLSRSGPPILFEANPFRHNPNLFLYGIFPSCFLAGRDFAKGNLKIERRGIIHNY
jgi:hypothetical protein